MDKYFFVIGIQFLLWHTCLSLQQCNGTISGSQMTVNCPFTITNQELPLYTFSVAELDSIVSLVAKGGEGTRSGPFTRIPANICLLRNLQTIDFSYNQIVNIDPTGSLITCVSNVITLDVSFNRISQFPSVMIYNMPNLINLYFQHNQLIDIPVTAFINISSLEIIDFSYNQLTTFELWALDVKTKADFRNNQISTITNKYFYTTFAKRFMQQGVFLSNNRAQINFTDAVYEMYNQCNEVYMWLFSNSNNLTELQWFTVKMADINFGTTEISCSCDQAYFLSLLSDSRYLNIRNLSIESAMCANDSLSVNDTILINSSCASPPHPVNSTVNFTQVYPRLCKIIEVDSGQLTTIPNTVLPSLNVSDYPYYETAFMNPGACVFSFSNGTTMSIHCTNDTSDSSSTIPASLLSSSYMSNITRITFPSLISSLPFYLCSLPSHQIDLSSQAFTTLTDATFPCLDSFNTVDLAFNQITSVSMSNGNFKNLNSLDLSSNRLTALPYSILTPSPTSLRYLDLRNNSLSSIDLFIYTLKNITVNLDNNPINSSIAINPRNVTISSISNSTANITFPSTVPNRTIIIQDSFALTNDTCYSFQSLKAYLSGLQSTFSTVLLACTCASINLKQIYAQNGLNITDDYKCSNSDDTNNFYGLNVSSCLNSPDYQAGLCANQTGSSSNSSTLGASNANSTPVGLIVGLCVGLGVPLVLGGFLAAFYLFNTKAPKPLPRKPVSRIAAVGQTSEDSLTSHVKPRSLRSVKLAPIVNPSQRLPTKPVLSAIPIPDSTALSHSSTNLSHRTRGIPIRLDSIRSPTNVNLQYLPNSNALNNTASFHPINNLSLNQAPIPKEQSQVPKLPKPPVDQMLNAGGDSRYQ
ncbi:unnamed protein product [Rotaria magnacalcarata]|uniref:Uncharacterized protein n=4 Tax=Rotaria magnacalcarata TaxID=392030 RepID=A0A815WHP9_9BILA|nr:unnamed protein product [Rotaria magnacalcarata]CAF1563013.1 unnamed protein product [Rotaria magnacalcarata]